MTVSVAKIEAEQIAGMSVLNALKQAFNEPKDDNNWHVAVYYISELINARFRLEIECDRDRFSAETSNYTSTKPPAYSERDIEMFAQGIYSVYRAKTPWTALHEEAKSAYIRVARDKLND